jgi:hypothetical protein
MQANPRGLVCRGAAKRGDRTGTTTGLLNGGQAAGGSMGRFAGEGDGVCGAAFQPVVDVQLRWSWTPFPACEEIVMDIGDCDCNSREL